MLLRETGTPLWVDVQGESLEIGLILNHKAGELLKSEFPTLLALTNLQQYCKGEHKSQHIYSPKGFFFVVAAGLSTQHGGETKSS